MIRLICQTLSLLLLVLSLTQDISAQNVSSQVQQREQLLKSIRAVDARGQGNEAASVAVQKLSQQDASALLEILYAFKGANPLAMNWLRSAFETIAERTLKEKMKFPKEHLELFFRDTNNSPHARRLAYEWLKRIEPKFEQQVLPQMLHDPSAEMRRDAVEMFINNAAKLQKEKKKSSAIATYKKALSGAYDEDQVKAIAKALKQLGEKIDVQQHYGFVSHWSMIGPFDNKKKIGFAAVYPPEKEINLKAKYKGQLGEVSWKQQSTDKEFGEMDIHTLYKNHKGSVMYATTEFLSANNQRVELRIGTPNAYKIWVNGKELFAREEYHRGMKIDQYRVAANFKKGKNVILVKICQNEQDDSWAQRYKFQLRVCKSSGIAVYSDK